VNVTADSFSDGGRFLDADDAVAHALALVEAGADVVELGPASSHPDAVQVPADEEICRLDPVLDALAPAGLTIAVDSWKTPTQRHCLARGVAMLNDIQGFADASFYPELRDSDCTLVVMHSVQGRGPATRVSQGPEDVLAHLDAFFEERVGALEAAGVDRQRLVLDPGMGFFLGDAPEPSLAVLHELPRLKERFGLPLLVSVSRKSFLGALTGRGVGERGAASLAAELFAAEQGADYVRTHDVAALRDALIVRRALA